MKSDIAKTANSNSRKETVKMEDTTKVLDLLDELEDLLEGATSVPLTNKIVLETEDIFGIIKDIRLALPDDMQQAKWIIDERQDPYGRKVRI